MSTDEIFLPVQIINGEEMYVPDLQDWETLFRLGSFRGEDSLRKT